MKMKTKAYKNVDKGNSKYERIVHFNIYTYQSPSRVYTLPEYILVNWCVRNDAAARRNNVCVCV